MDAERMMMQRRIDELNQYAERLHGSLIGCERENAQLKAELKAVKRERDAAIHDLNMSCSCAVCIKGDGEVNFVWRGLCKENGGAEE